MLTPEVPQSHGAPEPRPVPADASGRGEPAARIDWDFARRFSTQRITVEIRRSSFRKADTGVIDDLVQKCLLRLLRASQQEVHNVEGLMTTIARRVAVDFFRSQGPNQPLPDPPDQAAPEPDPTVDVDRLARIVLQAFEHDRRECVGLWQCWKDRVPWEACAEREGKGRTADACKKAWSRCLTWVRELLQQDRALMEDLGLA